jgi:hypothetical protein
MPGRQERRLELGRPVLLVLVLAPLGLEQGPLLVLEHCTMIHRLKVLVLLERRLGQVPIQERELERPQVLVLLLVLGRLELQVRLRTCCRACGGIRRLGRQERQLELGQPVPLVLEPAPLVLGQPQGLELERLRELGRQQERLQGLEQVPILQRVLQQGRQALPLHLRICCLVCTVICLGCRRRGQRAQRGRPSYW